jgi:5-methylthioadenosine/S-adenosylhomocysteine deaminase
VSTLLIHDCSVLHIPSDRPEVTILDHQDILVRGSRIEAIQPTGQVDRSQFAQVIDARGMLAAPGLINTHAHTPMVLFRGLAEDVTIDSWFNDYIWRLEHNLIPDDVHLGMLLGLAEMIEAGVTTVAEHYFHMHHAARAVEAGGRADCSDGRRSAAAAWICSRKAPTSSASGRARLTAASARCWPRMRLTPAATNS